MKITNKHNYPQTLVDAVSFDSHRTEGDISVTTLIGAPQVRYLRKKHGLEMTADVSEMMWALFGTAVHAILERANILDVRRNAFMEVISTLKEHHSRYLNNNLKENETEEEALEAQRVFKWLLSYMLKYFPEIKSRYEFELTLHYKCRGWVVSGTLDLFDKIDGILYDYKVTSVFMYMNPESRTSWKRQLNVYIKFLKESGYTVNGAKIVAIFRDFSRIRCATVRGYPRKQVMEIDIAMYEDDLITKWIDHRVNLHQQADKGIFNPCNGEERWASAPQYAVMDPDKKRALNGSVCDSKDVAEMFIKNNQHKYKKQLYIRETPEIWRKCEQYCNVNEFCEQFKVYNKTKPEDFTDV